MILLQRARHLSRYATPAKTRVVDEAIEALRAVTASLPAPPEAMSSYLAKVRDRAYAVTDADVEALTAAGLSDDAIFEQTIGVAIAQGLRRLDRAEEVIG
jgi:alkylhydroperoxidase family enzyme